VTSLRQALTGARSSLRNAGLDEAGIEAEVLLRHVLGFDRATLFKKLDEPLPDEPRVVFEGLIARRQAGEPTAYITGHREFYGRDFEVTPATLIPRPETELLAEAVIEAAGRLAGLRGPLIADVGTGSGIIAVTLALELPRAEVYASDVSLEALNVARANAERHGLTRRIAFRRCSLLDGFETQLDLIVANLPYVTLADWQALPREIREHEPRIALAAGVDGLDLIRRLLRQAPRYLLPGGAVLLEFGIGQAEAIEALAAAAFPNAQIAVRQDFAGLPRVLIAATASTASIRRTGRS
jgi:release factor glutamine methyltransferase